MTKSNNHVGLMIPRDLPIELFVDFIHKAEENGFDQLWLAEDCFYRGGFAQAATVLAKTTSLTVGIGILPAALRNPVAVALETSFLAELYPGRITLGLGHGMQGWMEQAGVWPESPLQLLREQLSTVRAILASDGPTDFAGRHVKLADVVLENRLDSIPMVLAGVRGPKSLALSGQFADGTILAEPATEEYIQSAIRDIGATTPHHIVAYNVAAVDSDIQTARERVRWSLKNIARPESRAHIRHLAIHDEILELKDRCATESDFVRALPNEWIDKLAVVGTAEVVAARISRLHDAYANTVVLVPPSGHPYLDSVDDLGRARRLVAADGLDHS
ncbi:LLM class flavin-dependent oxidoreductase [Rhodococcus sp. IEGM 1381]|uniref:LLM class flavin-dependent oxidoreductase n=1 Tax=Rhodococcus sp. IEGM 1381 TaxID=3047085 RepID=UPI0024B84790|nr:LLM class flavin-dependent oxidoreductase [Rhodococcus sp. IEGM 1381]MDI9893176.1 LLM class flavin-dependent oxidoreductase [Rhodococcus sp. IEGM 1381]